MLRLGIPEFERGEQSRHGMREERYFFGQASNFMTILSHQCSQEN